MRILLAKAAQVPLDGPIRDQGFTAEVSEDTYEILKSRGVLAASPEPAEKPKVEPKAPVEAEPEAEPEAKPKKLKKPARSANLSTWRSYAEYLGIKVAGMTKPEIIGAVGKVA